MISLFSYGTLQTPAVQHAKFGRLLAGERDMLPGYRLEPLPIDDEAVVRLSGQAVHRIARATGDARDGVTGTVLLLTPDELGQADAYEVSAYVRIEVTLSSGRRAFAYVGATLEGPTGS